VTCFTWHTLTICVQDVQDPKTGVYFYEKCLEVSRLTNDIAGEMSANHSLGLVHDKMGDITTATAYHERHQVSGSPRQQ
jgi:hypothetical protein